MEIYRDVFQGVSPSLCGLSVTCLAEVLASYHAFINHLRTADLILSSAEWQMLFVVFLPNSIYFTTTVNRPD